MSILPIGAATAGTVFPAANTTSVEQLGQAGSTSPTSPTSPTGGASGAGAAGGASNSFADLLGNALDNVQATQASADNMATQAATGSLTNVADYMVTAEEANVQTQLTAAVRNNALQAFQQIMGMQL